MLAGMDECLDRAARAHHDFACLSSPSCSLYSLILSLKSSPTLIPSHPLQLFIVILHPFCLFLFRRSCCSCLCRALRLINARTKKIFFLFFSFSFSLTAFKRLSPAEKNSCVHPVWSVALILMCTAFLAGRLHKGWLGRAQNRASECAEAETVCPDGATGAETAAYIIP